MGKVGIWAGAGMVAVILLVGAAVAGVGSIFSSGGVSCLAGPAEPGAEPAGLDAEQAAHAATIITVGQQLQVPPRGWIVAIATALQESGLRNLDYGDRDSLGLFQQRPSQGWGTTEQILDPAYAATKFYERLLTVPGWQQLPVTQAAQAVQRSAFPDAYAAHETRATEIVTAVASSGSWAIPGDLGQCLSSCPAIMSTATSGGLSGTVSAVACEWVAPVRAPVVSGFRTAQRPTHNGVDLGAARGSPIQAASAGTVVVVRCNVVPVSHGCDRDGSPSTPGCGWYVDIRHADEVYTRYCHMLTSPAVFEGQAVAVGQVIGVVGSSGHSSGPHLHFEVHVGGRSEGAVDPVVFMAGRGVRLG